MKWQLALGACLAAGVVAAVWFWPATRAVAAVTDHDLFAVRRGDLVVTLTENGTMVAKESKKVVSKIKGESKILFLVEEGKQVEEGEVVCRLDPTAAQEALEQVQLEVLQTEANLKTARTEHEIQAVENAAALTKARTELERARKEIEKYREGEAPQERNKLLVAIKSAETELNRAQKKYEDSKKLLAEAYINQSELDEDKIAFERTEVLKDSADTDLRLFDKYTFPMRVEELDTKLADAQREVETAQKRGESQLGQKAVAVQQVEKRLAVQNQQLKERTADLDNMTLTAPCPGIVVYGNPHEPWYRENVKVGGAIRGNFTVLTIPDLRVMQVKLKIHEADISKLRLGLGATVTTDSYPGLRLPAEVTKIATVAGSSSDWGNQSDVKSFDVEVTLAPGTTQLRPGISAKVEIHCDTRPATLFVPLQSVFAENGEHFCHVAAIGGEPQRRRVEVGASNDNYVEVTGGLAEGERVLLYNPSLPGAGSAPPPAPTPAEGAPATAGKDEARGAVEATAGKGS
ncbi:MAG: HlyD family efflux transporter periplasmic adaptor subunit [Planctomycetes bacterium]|nr:HlyD family efflux transporter periplasmic adaptor subunit [Planctomycetota bacterium]